MKDGLNKGNIENINKYTMLAPLLRWRGKPNMKKTNSIILSDPMTKTRIVLKRKY
jgi:hypothetical protein